MNNSGASIEPITNSASISNASEVSYERVSSVSAPVETVDFEGVSGGATPSQPTPPNAPGIEAISSREMANSRDAHREEYIRSQQEADRRNTYASVMSRDFNATPSHATLSNAMNHNRAQGLNSSNKTVDYLTTE